jgi:flagellar biosynthesis/type III secretory pathway protein FliH
MRKLWYRFDCWLCKDIIQEELTSALHPDFGWIWNEDQQGGILIKQARAEGYQAGFKEGYKMSYVPTGGEWLRLKNKGKHYETTIKNDLV